MVDAGIVVLVTLVSPFSKDRGMAKALFPKGDFYEVFVDTPIEVCASRDTKGLYRNESDNPTGLLTGISQVYEKPISPEVVVDGSRNVEKPVEDLVKLILARRTS